MEYTDTDIKRIETNISYPNLTEKDNFCYLCGVQILSELDCGGVAVVSELKFNTFERAKEVERHYYLCHDCTI